MGLFDARGGDLITYWKTVSDITNLVGAGSAARMYADNAKQGAAEPFIEFVRVGGEAESHLAGVSGTRHTILHVYCYGATNTASDALAEAVRTNTANYRGTMGGTYINWVECTDATDSGFTKQEDGSDAQRYWTRVILRITHAEALGV